MSERKGGAIYTPVPLYCQDEPSLAHISRQCSLFSTLAFRRCREVLTCDSCGSYNRSSP